jgi:hypothetical protein
MLHKRLLIGVSALALASSALAAMLLAMQRALHYEPKNEGDDDREYAFWLKLASDFAAKLAPYQSPKLQAVYVEAKEHRKDQDRPRTIAEVLARVEAETGLEGRRCFERFLNASKLDKGEDNKKGGPTQV